MMFNNKWNVKIENNKYSLHSYDDDESIGDLSLEEALNLIEQIVINNITELKYLMKSPTPEEIEEMAKEISKKSDSVLINATITDLIKLTDPFFNSEIREYYTGYNSNHFKQLLEKIAEEKPTIKNFIMDQIEQKELKINLYLHNS